MLSHCSADIEVNYTDDVGQTLLNWASAFGTQEMASYLIETFVKSHACCCEFFPFFLSDKVVAKVER